MTTWTAPLAATKFTVNGPLRAPVQMLADQAYDGHKSIHDGDAAARLGLRGAPIEGPTHFSQFEPLAAAIWGDRWFTEGCISSHFLNMVVEGEEVRAVLTVDGLGSSTARIDAAKADGTPVLTGTASIGDGPTELSERLGAAVARPAELFIVDQLVVGQVGANANEIVSMGFDDHMGELYPFTLREKLAAITENVSYFEPDAQTPWGGPIVPIEMISVLTGATSKGSGFKVRQPSLGLFIDLQVRMINGPVLVGHPYRLHREIVGLGASKRTESYWTKTTLFDGTTAVAEVLLHSGVFKDSYDGYPR